MRPEQNSKIATIAKPGKYIIFLSAPTLPNLKAAPSKWAKLKNWIHVIGE